MTDEFRYADCINSVRTSVCGVFSLGSDFGNWTQLCEIRTGQLALELTSLHLLLCLSFTLVSVGMLVTCTYCKG